LSSTTAALSGAVQVLESVSGSAQCERASWRVRPLRIVSSGAFVKKRVILKVTTSSTIVVSMGKDTCGLLLRGLMSNVNANAQFQRITYSDPKAITSSSINFPITSSFSFLRMQSICIETDASVKSVYPNSRNCFVLDLT